MMTDIVRKDLGFLVEVSESEEVEDVFYGHGKKDIIIDRVGSYFVIGSSEEDVEDRMRKLLPDPSPKEYKFLIKQAGQGINGVYSIETAKAS